MIGREQPMRPVTVAIGGCSLGPPTLNFSPALCFSVTPSSCERKSRCHQSRRNSPSVMLLQADALLALDGLDDGAVLGLTQLGAVERSGLETLAGVGEPIGTQKAADLIGTKRGVHRK